MKMISVAHSQLSGACTLLGGRDLGLFSKVFVHNVLF